MRGNCILLKLRLKLTKNIYFIKLLITSLVYFLPDQGSVGTPAVCATMLDAILSPSNHMACSDGPMNMIPFLAKSSGSFGFSDAWPQPAQTAEKRIVASFHQFLRIYFNKTPQTPIEIISRNIILFGLLSMYKTCSCTLSTR